MRVLELLAMTIAASVGLAACATPSLPDRQAVRNAAPAPSRVTVLGAGGEVAAAGRARNLVVAQAGDSNTDLLRTHLDRLSAGGDVDLYRGNHARLLVDGPATFKAMKAAIDKAQRRILLESYIVEDQGVAAEIGALLLRKAGQGVRVALLYDAVGSIATPDAFFAKLEEGGVATCAFNPINPVKRPGYWGINHRDHRKQLIVDDDVAFTGGINISRVYGSGSFSRAKRSAADGADALKDGWRDTQIEIRGPAVPAMSQLFAHTWQEQGCQAALGPSAPPAAVREPGDRVIKLLASDPRDPTNRIYTALLGAVEASRRSVQLTMAYFAPGEDFVAALCDAARRGVAVELVLPGRSDFALLIRHYLT